MNDKIKEEIEKTFISKRYKEKPTIPVCIIFNGKRVTLISGKSVWQTVGFAKSAMLNHLRNCKSEVISLWGGYYKTKEFLRELEKDGTIVYQPLK